jgi:hypothetical protein
MKKTINDMIKEGKTKNMKEFTNTYQNLLDDNKKNDATIESVCDALKEFLLAKNKNYGNSATEPVRVFSKSNANEGILVRMDDKLSRIKNSQSLKRNDMTDLAGYLILLMKNNGWDSFSDMID